MIQFLMVGLSNFREYVYIDYEPKDNEYMKFTKKSATYKQISDWVLSEYGLKIPNLYIAQVKDKLGFEKRENYNKGAEGHHVPQVTPEKEEAIMAALRHFEVI